MADNAPPRKLATIVALDVAGYSARTEADEAKTTAEVAALRSVIEAIAARHGGRVFNTAGDGFMLEFASSLAAVEAALELAATCEPKVRVGVHLGDVVVQPNGDLLGHGVNVAARLMAKSGPGGALISAAVRQTIRGPIADRLVSRGTFQLDKMAEAIEAFAIGDATAKPGLAPAEAIRRRISFGDGILPKPLARNWKLIAAPGVAALVVIAAVAALTWRGSAPAPGERSIAILPFENRSQTKDDSEYGDWLSELISSLLGKASELTVISQTSASAFKGKAVALPEIAKQLGVALVVEGSVRSEGDDIVISAQLINAATDKQVWREIYERKNDNALGVQSEVAAKVAGAVAAALDVTIAQGEQQQALNPTAKPEAFEAYQEALKLYRTTTEANVRSAQQLLNEAVKIDRDFALAWALLSRVHSYFYFNRSDATEGRRAAAEKALNEARRLKPKLAEVLLADAYFEYWVKRDYDGARVKFEELSAKWPSNADVLTALASIARRQGRWEEGSAYFERAVAIDPLRPGRRLKAAEAQFAMRDFAGALRQLDASLQHWPQAPGSLPFITKKALIFQALGRLDDADALLKGLAPEPDGELVQPIAYQALLRRRYDDAIHLLDELLKRDEAEGSVGRTSIDLNLALGDLRRLSGDAAGAKANYRQALDESRMDLAKQPENADIHSYLALSYCGLGDRAEATKYAALAVKTVPVAKDALSGAYYLDIQARVWARFGERDAAIPAIKALMKLPAPLPLTPALLRLDPDFDKLQTDARFTALLNDGP
jgi:TolB-like protein/class 3 adenylate cyclase/Tfp pilus assembly protein PilF